MDYSRIAKKLRDKIAGFSGELSRGLPKVTERFIKSYTPQSLLREPCVVGVQGVGA